MATAGVAVARKVKAVEAQTYCVRGISSLSALTASFTLLFVVLPRRQPDLLACLLSRRFNALASPAHAIRTSNPVLHTYTTTSLASFAARGTHASRLVGQPLVIQRLSSPTYSAILLCQHSSLPFLLPSHRHVISSIPSRIHALQRGLHGHSFQPILLS
jgi:hypothetical protein